MSSGKQDIELEADNPSAFTTRQTRDPVPVTQLDRQVGGSHYKDLEIQPVQYNELNHLTFAEGCVVKYVTRHRLDGGKGIQDIDKAIHFLELIKELQYNSESF